MSEKDSFGIVGGDKRQIVLAESLAGDGYRVYVYGFDLAGEIHGAVPADWKEGFDPCGTILLPLPVMASKGFLNAPYSGEKIPLDDSFAEKLRNKTVFGGKLRPVYATSAIWNAIEARDYSEREEFAVRNAISTAEGAIQTAMQVYAGTLHGSSCLIAGFGRIGKALSWMLRGLGADVTVSARKAADLAWIELYGYRAIRTEEIRGRYDLVFNTIPALVFPERVLEWMPSETILIDLASRPGGVDTKAAEKLGIRMIRALSLPGRVAPKAAGEIIKETVYNMMEEE